MDNVRFSRWPAASRVCLLSLGGFLLTACVLASLPFWLGPLGSWLGSWLASLATRLALWLTPFGAGLMSLLAGLERHVLPASVLNTIGAAFAAAALAYFLWLVVHAELGKALARPWCWRGIVRRGLLPAIALGVNLLLLQCAPTSAALGTAMSAAGGLPPELVVFCATGLQIMWHAPASLLFLFVLGCFFATLREHE